MSEVYTPSLVELVNLLLPSGGDLRNTGSVNGPFKRLADAVAFLQAHPYVLDFNTITDANTNTGTAGTITSPATCIAAIVIGWSGGGAGGTGGIAADSTSYGDDFAQNVGGGGGGGARRVIDVVPIVPNTLHSYFVAGSLGYPYSGGSDTTFTNAASVELFRARGASGGGVGQWVKAFEPYLLTTTPTFGTRPLYGFMNGGSPTWPTFGGTDYIIDAPKSFALSRDAIDIVALARHPQYGGLGLSAKAAALGIPYGIGGSSPEGYDGGAPGGFATNFDGTISGGGSGGGGGAGPGGVGGAGGKGGNAAAGGSGPGQNGFAGATPAAGSGAGGGGGGGVGGSIDADTYPGTGGAYGRGGSGKIKIIWLKRS